MQYHKREGVQGGWVKASELENGTLVALVSEVMPMQGEFGEQDVGKLKIEGVDEIKNVRLNKATINALIDAFGTDSKEWVKKPLTAQTEKMVVSGRRVTALYLIPEGFRLGEDSGGYIVITRDKDDKEVIPDEDVPF